MEVEQPPNAPRAAAAAGGGRSEPSVVHYVWRDAALTVLRWGRLFESKSESADCVLGGWLGLKGGVGTGFSIAQYRLR